jgi:signal transduction histidine kinase
VLKSSWKKLPVQSRGIVILAIPMLCLLAAVAVFSSYQRLLAQDKRLLSEVKQIKILTQQLLVTLAAAETGIQNYGLTGEAGFLESYEAAMVQLPELRNQLMQSKSGTDRSAAVAELEDLLQQSQLQLQQQRATVAHTQQTADLNQLYRWLRQDDTVLNQTRTAMDRLIAQEEQQREQFQQNLEMQQQRGFWLIWTFIGVGTISSGLAIVLFRQLAQELNDRERQLQQANQQLSQANERLQRFTADASHELRAPVAAILGQAQAGILAVQPTPQMLQQRLQSIVGTAKSMSTLVNSLLFLARHETATVPDVAAIDLVPLLLELRDSYAAEAAQAQIQFSAVIPEMPVQVATEPDLLRQAIANLLDNALRYTSAGGTVQLQMVVQTQQVAIQVNDTGIGIPAADLPYIFDRFYRVDQARSKTGGFGLGLAIAQQIVQTFGGEISVSSEVGVGSQFQILLPQFKAKG